jgi:hypothetical protein
MSDQPDNPRRPAGRPPARWRATDLIVQSTPKSEDREYARALWLRYAPRSLRGLVDAVLVDDRGFVVDQGA